VVAYSGGSRDYWQLVKKNLAVAAIAATWGSLRMTLDNGIAERLKS